MRQFALDIPWLSPRQGKGWGYRIHSRLHEGLLAIRKERCA